MESYARSLEEIEIRDGKNTESLTREELKVLRKYIGKLSWPTAGMRPDLSVSASELAKKQKNVTLGDLKHINRIIMKVQGNYKSSRQERFVSDGSKLCLI